MVKGKVVITITIEEPWYSEGPPSDEDMYQIRNVCIDCAEATEFDFEPMPELSTDFQSTAYTWGHGSDINPITVAEADGHAD